MAKYEDIVQALANKKLDRAIRSDLKKAGLSEYKGAYLLLVTYECLKLHIGGPKDKDFLLKKLAPGGPDTVRDCFDFDAAKTKCVLVATIDDITLTLPLSIEAYANGGIWELTYDGTQSIQLDLMNDRWWDEVCEKLSDALRDKALAAV